MDINGDTTTIILYFDRVVFVDDDLDVITVACEGFVDGVIYYLVYQVMESLFTDVTYVHGRTLAHSF